MFWKCSYAMTKPMSEKYDRPVSREDLLFTVEMALRKASKLWPKKHVPGDHDRLRPVAESVVAHFELCGIRFFRKARRAATARPSPIGAPADRRCGRTG